MFSQESSCYAKFDLDLLPVDYVFGENELSLLLQQIAYSLMELKPIDAQLENFYRLEGGEFIAIGNRDEVNCNLLKRLNEKRMDFIWVTAKLPLISVDMMISFIHNICQSGKRYEIKWKLDGSPKSLFDPPTNLNVINMDVDSFSLGNLIRTNQFAIHFDSNCSQQSDSIQINEISVEIDNKAKIFHLNFMITKGRVEKLFKLKVDENIIHKFYTSVNDLDGEFYFRLICPPELLVKEGNDWNSWNDWNSGILSRDQFGKSTVLMFKIHQQSRENLSTLIRVIHADFLSSSCDDLEFMAIKKLFVNYGEDFLQNDFPFEVKYALECVNSTSYAFADDLFIYNNKNILFEKINSYIAAGKMDIIVEALYELFNSHFSLGAIGQLEKALECVADRGSNRKFGDNFMKNIILTPLQIIYLPPSPVPSSITLPKKTSPKYIIGVFVRSREVLQFFEYPNYAVYHDKTTIVKRNDNNSVNFFEQLFMDKIFTRTDSFSLQSIEYWQNQSLSKLFTQGILLEANELAA
ncbi:uncharacterized protein LOC128396289 [Panonychus citri]|uniref:uncharacterized protein LOC128396289 n=1 Tax=Panonychus citri TaxID=50023 RepID=UPI0023070267|nr:uncharacterized protein LOC128396289 [Panonychus citri]